MLELVSVFVVLLFWIIFIEVEIFLRVFGDVCVIEYEKIFLWSDLYCIGVDGIWKINLCFMLLSNLLFLELIVGEINFVENLLSGIILIEDLVFIGIWLWW